MLNNSANLITGENQGKKFLETGSAFITEKVAILCKRFSIEYRRDHNQVEYFITDNSDNLEVSFSLVFCRNIFSKQLHVSKFYPGLFRRPDCKYLSAASFFLMVHHCAGLFAMGSEYSIFLQCRHPVYRNFYSRLDDFALHIVRDGQGENVDVIGPFQPSGIDTAMIKLRRDPS